ncbi:phytoene synthase [Sporosarcina luteola]|nr:phytoene synthase [Sporosarcina luteola]
MNRFAVYQEDDHPLWRALRDVFNRYEMDIEPFYDQLTGQLMDIHFNQPETMEAMETYSYFVAGSVGRMLLPIIASQAKDDCVDIAVSLGIAMQITNILRDVGEDYVKHRRIYLPKQEMQVAQYTPLHLATYEVTEGFKELWERMASRAETLYDEFLGKVDLFDQDSQFAVLSSALIYRAILTSIRQNGYDCLRMRNYVSTHQMLQILSEATG